MSIFWAYLQFRALVWLLRMTGRLLAVAAVAALLVAAAPLTLVTAVGLAGAWLRGWPPARLWRAAAWALPMTAVYLAGRAVQARTWQGLALAPVHDWLTGWSAVTAGRVVTAFVLVAPLAVPAGLAIAGCLWAWRIYALDTGLAGKTATTPVVFDARQWKRQARAARARITAPGTVPLADRHGRVVMGAVIRAVGPRWQPSLAIPYTAFGRHQVIIGSSGSGKTNLMIRTWAGWYSAALTAHHRHGTPRPLLVVLDCKGGPDARVKAERTRRLLHAVGAARVAVWPDDTAVSLWGLPPRELAVTLFQMIDTGTGPAAYYADVTQAVITLAITAPPGPPTDGAAFLDRLKLGWLEAAYAGDPPPGAWPAHSGLPGPGRPPFCQSPTGTSPYSAGPGAAPGLPGALMSAGRPCLKVVTPCISYRGASAPSDTPRNRPARMRPSDHGESAVRAAQPPPGDDQRAWPAGCHADQRR